MPSCAGVPSRESRAIYVHTTGFDPAPDGEGELADAGRHADNFAFRLGRSRETAFSREYDELYELLKHEREHGYVVWVMGPAFSFNGFSRTAFSKIIEAGYVDAVFAETRWPRTIWRALTSTRRSARTSRRRRTARSATTTTWTPSTACGCTAPSAGSSRRSRCRAASCTRWRRRACPTCWPAPIRDDGPLPCVLGNAYDAQDAMRSHLRKATTVVCMATMLHTIATGNMTPSYRVLADGTVRQVYFYCVDIAEFAVNKLIDRGSLASRGIVTNVQDFIANVAKGLGL